MEISWNFGARGRFLGQCRACGFVVSGRHVVVFVVQSAAALCCEFACGGRAVVGGGWVGRDGRVGAVSFRASVRAAAVTTRCAAVSQLQGRWAAASWPSWSKNGRVKGPKRAKVVARVRSRLSVTVKCDH